MILCAGALAGCNRYLEVGQKAIGGSGGAAPTADAGSGGAPMMDAGGGEEAAADGPASSILWSSDLESGDFSDWQRGGAAAGGVVREHVDATVATGQAHSGTHAVRINFDTSDGQADHMAELYRRVPTAPAYYSAWFFIDGAHTPDQYWTIFYFFYQRTPGDTTTRHGLWDINLGRTNVYFFDEPNTHTINPTTPKAYPMGRWFHLEAFFEYQPARNGHVRLWLDGDEVMDVTNLGAAPSDNLYWGIGSDNDHMTPSSCTVYVDDATISTERLGP